jgi:FkbM family methyltransferase
MDKSISKRLASDYEVACRRRAEFSKEGQKFEIGDLLKLPAFFGWVDCRVQMENFVMFLAGSDDGVALRFFWNGAYEPLTLSLWTDLVATFGDGDVVLDVGAHTGAFSLASLAINRKLRVFSFEPNYFNFSRLTINFRANNFPLHGLFSLACSDSDGNAVLSTQGYGGYLSSGCRLTDEHSSGGFLVNKKRLDSIFDGYDSVERCRLLKIDIEGHEPKCIEGALNLTVKAKPVIFFEALDDLSLMHTWRLLESLGYQFFSIDDLRLSLSELNIGKSPALSGSFLPPGCRNVLACPQNRLNWLEGKLGLW